MRCWILNKIQVIIPIKKNAMLCNGWTRPILTQPDLFPPWLKVKNTYHPVIKYSSIHGYRVNSAQEQFWCIFISGARPGQRPFVWFACKPCAGDHFPHKVIATIDLGPIDSRPLNRRSQLLDHSNSSRSKIYVGTLRSHFNQVFGHSIR